MSLAKEIDQMLNIGLWKFDGLPDEIKIKLDQLIKINSVNELLDVMNTLLSAYKDEERRTREDMGRSGMAGEFHMATEMKLLYLKQSIEYVQSPNTP